MRFPQTPQAVIFDMDGLLLDTIPLYLSAFSQASADLGLSISFTYLQSLIGLLGHELRDRLLRDFGSAFPADALLETSRGHLGDLMHQGVTLKAGAIELIGHLCSLGVPLGIATSMTTSEAAQHLEQAQVHQFFQAVVGRDLVHAGKPHPDVYLAAAARLQLQPNRCIALEDSFTGIRSAQRAGCMVIMVPDRLMPTTEIRDLCIGVVDNLLALKALLPFGQ